MCIYTYTLPKTVQQASVAGEQVLGLSTTNSKADACRDSTANVWLSALGTLIVVKTTEVHFTGRDFH